MPRSRPPYGPEFRRQMIEFVRRLILAGQYTDHPPDDPHLLEPA